MNKEKKLIINYISWFLCFFILVFVGISNIFALDYSTTYADTQTYYDNFGSSATAIGQTWNSSLQSYISNNLGTTANSYGGLVVINTPIPIIANHTYSLSFYFNERYNIANSSKSYISIGNTIDGTKYNYVNNQFWADTVVSKVINNAILQFVFTASGGADYIGIPWTTTSNITQNYSVSGFIIEDLGGEGISESTIQNQLDTTASYLKGNIDYMQQQIILNQNTNNQAVIGAIDETLKSCRSSYNLVNPNVSTSSQLTITASGTGTLSGSIASNFAFNFGSMNLKGNTTYSFNSNLIGSLNGSYFLTSDNGSFIYLNNNQTFSVSQDGSYNLAMVVIAGTYNNVSFKPMVNEGSTSLPFESFGISVCTNKIDDTNSQLNDLNNSLTDETGPNTSGLSNVAGWLPPGPVDSILTLPLTFLNSLNNAIGGSCSAVNVNLPFVNKTLNIPCFTTFMSQYLPNFNTLYTWIGGIVSVYILFNYLLSLYKWVDDTLSLRENTMPGYFDDRFGGGA